MQVEITEAVQHAADQDRSIRTAALPKVGRSAAKRQKAILQLQRRLHNETQLDRQSGRVLGPLRPCTLVNFNPIPVLLEIEGRRITIPASGKYEDKQVKLTHAGRNVQGHYLFINAPILYTRITGHEADAQLASIDVPVAEPQYYSPHAIGCIFHEQYNSPNFKLMGGLLFFDQDVRQLTSEQMDRWGGRIWVPERQQIEDSPEYVYSLRETPFEDEMEFLFRRQREYCDVIIQQAHALWAEQDVNSRKMVTDTHRDWARYAVQMFWMKDLPEWVTQKVTAAGPIVELVKCKYCGTQQPSPDVLFCKACSHNAPYDTYKAWKWRGPNGERVIVPQMYLEMLEGEQLEEVLADMEEQRRKRARFEALKGGLTPAAAPGETVPGKQLHGAAKAAAEAKAAREAAAQQGSGE